MNRGRRRHSPLPGPRRVLRALLALCAWPLAAPHAVAGAPAVRAVLSVAGRRLELPPERLAHSALVELCEAQVRGADGVLRLAVSNDTIAVLQRDAMTVELVYAEPRTFALAVGGGSIVANRLLVPLSGELAGSITTIFHGNPEYRAGPLRNQRGSAGIASAVDALRKPAR